MRKIFTLLMLWATCAVGFSQTPAPNPYTKFSLTDTVRMNGILRDELYSRAWNWFQKASATKPNLLEEANKKYGRFRGVTEIPYDLQKGGVGNNFVKGKIYYAINVVVADDYYVYEFTDFTHLARISFDLLTTSPIYPYPNGNANKDWYTLVWQNMKNNVRNQVNPVIADLRLGMQKETEKSPKAAAPTVSTEKSAAPKTTPTKMSY
jgi:hypothetical protein